MRAIRGAICAKRNAREEIRRATRRLLHEILTRNQLTEKEIIAAFFSMTPDLDAEFPAYAARDMGWTEVAMLGAQESPVAGAPERAIRVLLLAEGEGEVRNVYLGRAAAMRPDLAEPGDASSWDGSSGSGAASLGRLLVVGLGLIGGSVAAAARASGSFERVDGFDIDPATAERALELDLVEGCPPDLGSGVEEADIVVLATPVGELVSLIERVGSALRPGSLLTDAGSVKAGVVSAMNRLPEGVRAVAGHPMAGKTESGPGAANASLFRGASWALMATRRTDDLARGQVERFVAAMGGTPLWTTAEGHDKAVAVTSHLPVLGAVALVRSLTDRRRAGPQTPLLVGPGFRDATRLAAGHPVMTGEMLAENAEEIEAALEAYREHLGRIRAALRDRSAMAELLGSARAERARLLEESTRGREQVQ